jgi:hypothetical protein
MAFKFNRTNYQDPDREWRERLDRIEDMLAYSVISQWETLQMITPQIQDALDRIRQTQTLAHSISQALQLQSTQIGTLTDKVTELQNKLDQGGTISADDLAAVAEISGDIDTVNAELQSAVPANTQTPKPGIPGGSEPPAASGDQSNPNQPAPTTPPIDQPQDAQPTPPTQEDAEAAAAAKPL